MEKQIDEGKRFLFAKLSAFYLKNRYPEYKEKLSKSLEKKEAKDVMKKTKEAFKWLLTLKPQKL